MRIAPLLMLLCLAAAPATQPAQRAIPLKDVLVNLPVDARPTSSKWDAFAVEKANEWAASSLVGRDVEGTLHVREVEVRRRADGWVVTLIPGVVPVQAGKSTVAAMLKPPGEQRYTFAGDEPLAKAAGKWKAGDPVRLRGTVARFEADGGSALLDERGGRSAGVVRIYLGAASLVEAGSFRPPQPIPATTQPTD